LPIEIASFLAERISFGGCRLALALCVRCAAGCGWSVGEREEEFLSACLAGFRPAARRAAHADQAHVRGLDEEPPSGPGRLTTSAEHQQLVGIQCGTAFHNSAMVPDAVGAVVDDDDLVDGLLHLLEQVARTRIVLPSLLR
jgi:hypothetical protein